MSERTLAIAWIGGLLDVRHARVLIDAINDTPVFGNEGDTYFQPRSVEDLVAALDDCGHLHLCDDSAPGGEMPAITEACRSLNLSYRLWHEAHPDIGSRVEFWAPGMGQPLLLAGDPADSSTFLVSGPAVAHALELLERGRDRDAARVLESLAPAVPVLPRFEVVGLGVTHPSTDEPRTAQSGG